jgi:hypothetical protein
MALGDPLIVVTLAQLPNARINLAALGIAKAIVIFFESPIIMLLHASNTLAAHKLSRQLLWKFMVISCCVLTLSLGILTLPSVFGFVSQYFFGTEDLLALRSREILLFLTLWPATIAWRRYYQGLLIHEGNAQSIKRASLLRLLSVVAILFIGFRMDVSGATIAGVALMGGVFIETLFVSLAYYQQKNASSHETLDTREISEKKSVKNLADIWSFYWPLACSMVVVWGGRALLLALVARSVDSAIALAAWPAAWGLVLVIANATRMVQQVVIRNRGRVSDFSLMTFASTVGISFFALLLLMALTPVGLKIVQTFIGNDSGLLAGVIPVILLCSAVPLLVAIQNATQGLLISEGRTGRVNMATGLGTGLLLIVAAIGVAAGIPGATASAIAMVCALVVETLCLGMGLPHIFFKKTLAQQS